MGARWFIYYDYIHYDTQENKKNQVFCDGDPWPKVEARFIRRAERAK